MFNDKRKNQKMKQELKEILAMLEMAGMNPQVCDTPVAYDHRAVRCGNPTMPGDDDWGDYCMMPRRLMGNGLEFFIDITGDSMRGAGFEPGDRIRVRTDVTARDGDIVVASVDGEFTVKVFFTDEQGHHWLVPQNEAFAPILLTEQMQVNIIGRVIEVVKDTPHLSSSECLKAIHRAQSKLENPPEEQVVENAIRQIAPMVENGRQWYAVYRALCDRKAVETDDFYGFAALVARVVPDHPHLPVGSELIRLAIGSFRKPVTLWDRNDAPVRGKRFEAYLRIARLMLAQL